MVQTPNGHDRQRPPKKRTFNPTIENPHIPPGTSITTTDTFTIVESIRLSSAFLVKCRYVVAGIDQNCEPIIRQETLNQGWKYQSATASD